jgi:hypothetical protein
VFALKNVLAVMFFHFGYPPVSGAIEEFLDLKEMISSIAPKMNLS